MKSRIELMTETEREATNRYWRWGINCIQKVGKKWDSTVPGLPMLFSTKSAAYDALTKYVCEAIPLNIELRKETNH